MTWTKTSAAKIVHDTGLKGLEELTKMPAWLEQRWKPGMTLVTIIPDDDSFRYVLIGAEVDLDQADKIVNDVSEGISSFAEKPAFMKVLKQNLEAM